MSSSGRPKSTSAPKPRGEPRLSGGYATPPGSGGGGGRSGGGGGRRSGGGGKRGRWKWVVSYRKLVILGILLVVAGGVYITWDLPSMSTVGDFKKTPSVTVKAEDGTVVGTYGDVYGDYVPYTAMPKYLIQAVVATEDRNYFYHFGVDPLGLLRATFVNIRARHVVQGGSTITQQLAKNVFLSPERTLKRKIQEMILAIKLEQKFTKEDILTLYLNRVYMGAGNYGVDAASRRYFGHSVRELTLSESAILVGLLKAPSRYAPTSNPDLSEKRAYQVLLNMVDAGYLTVKDAAKAKAEWKEEDATYRDNHGFGSFYFSDYVVSQLDELIGDVKEDVVVTTTLKPEWQHAADDAVASVLNAKGKTDNASQGALLAMTPDGAIRAMVGGRNYRASQFNRATQGLRQPGSSFKLFVYLAALEAGYTPDYEMEDQPISVGKWKPKNYTGKYEGRMTLRNALAQSINSIAVQLSEAIGRGKVVEMAQRLGITASMNPDPSIALGTSEVTLIDMTRAYAHLASGGQTVTPYSIIRIEGENGRKLFERKAPGTNQEIGPSVVGMMNNMLLGVTAFGTGRGASLGGRPVAGKTGTTSDYRDAWFIGFTPQVVTGVWVGNDDTTPMKKVTGGTLPASIFRSFMNESLKGAAALTIPNQSGGEGSVGGGGGFLPWLFDSGASTSSPSPRQMQNPGVPGSGQLPTPKPRPAGPDPIPEEQPTPSYDVPESFWDKLLGEDNVEYNYPKPKPRRP